MCLNGTYPFLSATLIQQLPYYLFRETCFMDSYPRVGFLIYKHYIALIFQRKNFFAAAAAGPIKLCLSSSGECLMYPLPKPE